MSAASAADAEELPSGLRAAKWRMTSLFAAAALLGTAVLASVAVLAQDPPAQDALLPDLRRRAQIAAVLVYQQDDESGPLQLDALRDDDVFTEAGADLVVYAREEGGAFAPVAASPDPAGTARAFDGLAAALLDAQPGSGVAREVTDAAGRRLAGYAHPVFGGPGGDGVVGAAVASAVRPEAAASSRTAVILAAAAVVAALLALAGRGIATIGIRPAVEGLRQRRMFLAAAAHELRTPAARVLALTQQAELSTAQLRDGLRAGDGREQERLERLARDLRRATTVADRGGRTVSNLLTVERIDAGGLVPSRVPVRLDQLVAELENHHPTVAAEIEHPVRVDGDEVLLRLALTNLVVNAEQHAAREGAAPTVVVRCRAAGRDAWIDVADDGPGMPPELTGTLFDRYRSAGPGAGSGLGLWLVRWVAEAHRGTVDVATGPGGTRFTIRLPAVSETSGGTS